MTRAALSLFAITLMALTAAVLIVTVVVPGLAVGILAGVESARRALKTLAREKLGPDDAAEFIRLLGSMLKDVNQ